MLRFNSMVGNRSTQRLIQAKQQGLNLDSGISRMLDSPSSGKLILVQELAEAGVLREQERGKARHEDAESSQRQTVQTPLVQRADDGNSEVGDIDDPAFLLCLILCYLGIPPAMWKSAVELFLRGVWEEYRETYGEEAASENFRSYKEEFRLYSPVKVIAAILTFVVQGKVGPIPIRTAAAAALRRQLEAYLIRRGATVAGLAVAEQVARKIVIAVEVVFAAGCAAYCGGIAYANAIVDMTQVVLEGVATAMKVLETVGGLIGSAVTGIFVRPLLVARATVNPLNWEWTDMPSRSRGNLNVVGLIIWSNMGVNDPNEFAANVTKPLNEYPIPDILDDVAEDVTSALGKRGGFYGMVEFTPELVGGMSLLRLVQMLDEWKFLKFKQSPEMIADEQLRGEGE
ncbi:MAG: hypothetical protein OEN50_18845 [Deltaproteobacteria bacterium]|nr:hypothetical protein [Deltaproteobacteria bacterium]